MKITMKAKIARAILSAALCGPIAALAANTFTAISGSDWNTAANWSEGVPVAGQAVVIDGNATLTNATPALASLTVNSAKTLTFDGWDTLLSATTVTIVGTVTHAQNTAATTNSLGAWVPNARVNIVCSNLTVNSGASINVNGKGYRGGLTSQTDGCGPGRGQGMGSAGGAGHGGVGGRAAGVYGQVNGDGASPDEPGSGGGGGMTTNIPGGSGGGVVRIVATGKVEVVGTVAANGSGRSGHYSGGGSGGAIRITCNTLTGSGTISANGETTGSQGGAGGGGRISIRYDAAAQSQVAVPTLRISASGAGDSVFSDLGTLDFTDNQLLLNQTGSLKFSGEWLPPLTKWERESLTMDSAWIRFPADGFEMTITNSLTIQGTKSYLHGLELTNGVLKCGSNVTINASSLILRTREDSGPLFSCGGTLMVSNAAAMRIYAAVTETPAEHGALVDVAGDMVVTKTSWVYPYSHPTNGGSVQFKVDSLILPEANAGFNANGLGYRGGRFTNQDGCGPGRGKGTTYGGGGGYGGFGGGDSIPLYGQTNGVAYAPFGPGSGGGAGQNVNYPASSGGGAIRIQAKRGVMVNGSLLANGTGRTKHYAGGASGGGIFIICKTFEGSGVLSANGDPSGDSNLSGGGGGGRIAVWLNVPESLWSRYFAGNLGQATLSSTPPPTFAGTATAGIGAYSRTPLPTVGTVVFLTPPPMASLMLVR